MPNTIRENIEKLFKENSELTVKEIVNTLQVSKQMVHLVLKKMLEEGKLEKLGRPPKTVYRLSKGKQFTVDETSLNLLSEETRKFIQENFMVITDLGNKLEGVEAFGYWCNLRKMSFNKMSEDFVSLKKSLQKYYDTDGNINGIKKLKNTKELEKIWLDDLFYLDFYAIERFGKTKLGTQLHFAKQGQNKFLMNEMMNDISDRIKKFVEAQHADAVGFVPPTIRREVQLMKFIENYLQIPLPVIEIKKIGGIIPIPQKSLSKMNERIKNAENTFMITDKHTYKKIVLIDDAVGSGATMNEIAKKIKMKKVSEKVVGLAIVGSFKGFDIITDI